MGGQGSAGQSPVFRSIPCRVPRMGAPALQPIERIQIMRDKITRYIRAGYAGLYLVSHEEQRVEAELKAVATQLKHGLYAWSVTEGLIDTTKGTIRDCGEPLEVLALTHELPEGSILLLRDFHQF